MDLEIRGRRALVLAASTGIGRAVAGALAAEGARVAICARGEERLRTTAAGIGATAFVCDLEEPGAGVAAATRAARELGGVDILVTNAGGPPPGAFGDLSDADWMGGFHGLWMSAASAIRAVLPGMRERDWGRILLVTSVAAREPVPNLTISNALRAGLLGLAKSLAREVAADGVTVNALLPGYTRTRRLEELGRDLEELAAGVPARRLAEPDELAALAAFLASERAGYITGQAIAVDGGLLRGI